MIAAKSIIIRNACFLYFDNMSEDMNPIFAKAYTMTGNWKTNPITRVNIVKVST